MGNILGIITRHYYRPLLPQRRRVARDKVPLMSWSKKGGTVRSFSSRGLLSSHVEYVAI